MVSYKRGVNELKGEIFRIIVSNNVRNRITMIRFLSQKLALFSGGGVELRYMELFSSKNYRDNLAKDLKEIRKEDRELAKTVLEEEQKTTRYDMANKANAQDRKKRVEDFHEMRENILQGNFVKLDVIKSQIKTNVIESLNFTHEELQEIAVKMFSQMNDDKTWLQISSKGPGADDFTFYGLRYLKNIGYDMNIENIGEVLTKVIESDALAIYQITNIVRNADRKEFIENNSKYFLRFPISQEAAKHLLAKAKREGNKVYDQEDIKDKMEKQICLTWANGSDDLILTY